MQQYSKSYKSRQSNAQGKLFEEMILLGCQFYRNKGIAEVERTPEPFKVMQKLGKGQFKVISLGKAQPDFQGTLKGGKSIVFEAKFTASKDNRISKSVLSPAQNEYLQSHHEKGAVTGVCVGVNRTYAFIPWKVWSNMKEIYGRQYIKESELGEFKVKTPGMIRFLDLEGGGNYYGYEA